MGWLEEKIKQFRAVGPPNNLGEGENFPQWAEYLALLLSNSPDAVKIRRWFKRNNRPENKSRSRQYHEDWEVEIWFLSFQFFEFRPMDIWETMPAERRRSHAHHVSRLCRELADTLEEEARPYYPPVLEFFDTERAIDIIRSLPKGDARLLLSFTGFSLNRRDGYKKNGSPAWIEDGKPKYYEPSSKLAKWFSSPNSQQFPSLLRQLANYAEACVEKPKRDQRPTFPNRDARVFARQLANHFALAFAKRPLEVITSCVALMFPNLDPPPQKELIRGWLGDR